MNTQDADWLSVLAHDHLNALCAKLLNMSEKGKDDLAFILNQRPHTYLLFTRAFLAGYAEAKRQTDPAASAGTASSPPD